MGDERGVSGGSGGRALVRTRWARAVPAHPHFRLLNWQAIDGLFDGFRCLTPLSQPKWILQAPPSRCPSSCGVWRRRRVPHPPFARRIGSQVRRRRLRPQIDRRSLETKDQIGQIDRRSLETKDISTSPTGLRGVASRAAGRAHVHIDKRK